MSTKKLQETLVGDNIPTKLQILKLAERLAVPPHAFFMEGFEVSPSEIIDFRASKSVTLKYGRDAHRFQNIIDIRDFLADLYNRLDWAAPDNLFEVEPDTNPEQFASAISKLIQLRSLREAAKTKADFYRLFRKSVEDLGIYVIQDHNISTTIDGFAIYHSSFSSNLIYINSSKRNHGAKSFTLAHELSHIFGKRSAITNNYQFDNDVETFANDFAASLLIPRDDLIDEISKGKFYFQEYGPAVSAATRLSEVFKSSVSAMLVRLSKLGYVKWEYSQRFMTGFGKEAFPDTQKPRGHGGKDGPDPGVIDLAYLGSRAVSVISSALASGLTTKYEIFEKTGLSKKRIEGLLAIANEKNLVKEKTHAISI